MDPIYVHGCGEMKMRMLKIALGEGGRGRGGGGQPSALPTLKRFSFQHYHILREEFSSESFKSFLYRK